MLEILLYAGAVSWMSTAIMYKTGPPIYWYTNENNEEITLYLFSSIKRALDTILGRFSPTSCVFCLGPWVLAIVYPLGQWLPPVIYFFGILGIGAYLRGGSQEYG